MKQTAKTAYEISDEIEEYAKGLLDISQPVKIAHDIADELMECGRKLLELVNILRGPSS